MEPLHGKNGIYAVFQVDHYIKSPVTNAGGGKVLLPLPPENQTQDIYYTLLMDSVFAASPRGDNLYSVRLAESLSAAAVPVIYADGWVLPYTKDVVDWSDLAVILPQRKVNQTLDVLRSISNEERCRMQQRILTFYQQYVANSTGRLRGVLKILDARMNKASKDITIFTSAR
jgi:Cft2 family RNA processing exonuclease